MFGGNCFDRTIVLIPKCHMYIRDSHDEKWIFSCWKCGCKHAKIFGIQCIFETSKWGHDRGLCYVYCNTVQYVHILKSKPLLSSIVCTVIIVYRNPYKWNPTPSPSQFKSKKIIKRAPPVKDLPCKQSHTSDATTVVVQNPLRSYYRTQKRSLLKASSSSNTRCFWGYIHYHESRPAHISRLDSCDICFG